MKNYIKIFLLTFCGIVAFPIFAATNQDTIDNIIATVNDSIITQSELKHEIVTAKRQIAVNKMTPPPENTLRKQVLEQLINRKLQLQLASQSHLTVTEKDVDEAVAHIAELNQLSPADIYQKVTAQGVSKSDYRKELKDEILLQKIQQQEVGAKISISPQEIDDFIHSNNTVSNNKEYHLEDILIALPDEPTSQQITEAKKRAEVILDRVQHGVNFREAALSESNAHALQGGDLGWRKIPEIPTIFVNRVIHAKPNDIIGPVQAPNGFHLVRVTGLRNVKTDNNATSNDREQIQQLIFQRKLEEGLQTWIAKLRNGAYINVTPETEIA